MSDVTFRCLGLPQNALFLTMPPPAIRQLARGAPLEELQRDLWNVILRSGLNPL